MPTGPLLRPRRLRQNAAVRALVAQTRLHPSELVLPVFVAEGIDEPRPILSMPGVAQHSLASVKDVAAQAVSAGLGGIMVFGVPTTKDATGSGGIDPNGMLNRALSVIRDVVGDDTVVTADTCLDEFTDHGHCGVLDDLGRVGLLWGAWTGQESADVDAAAGGDGDKAGEFHGAHFRL